MAERDGEHPSPEQQVRTLYEQAESRTAEAMERVVARESFGELLARVTENAVALGKLRTDAMDLVLRNLRLAGRQDVTRLARQLARTEDKLERVLVEVERLQDQLAAAPPRDQVKPAAANGARRGSRPASGRRRSTTRKADS